MYIEEKTQKQIREVRKILMKAQILLVKMYQRSAGKLSDDCEWAVDTLDEIRHDLKEYE